MNLARPQKQQKRFRLRNIPTSFYFAAISILSLFPHAYLFYLNNKEGGQERYLSSPEKREQKMLWEKNLESIQRKGSNVKIRKRAASLKQDATFSACLLIRDDNRILDEWIAYHYHVLKMRYLIVAVDPLSEEFPADILDKWSQHTNITIEQWDDEMYMTPYFLENGIPPVNMTALLGQGWVMGNYTEENLWEIASHRYRQRVFLMQCLRKLKKQNQTWTVHVDTDEYVVPSKILRQMKSKYVHLPPMEKPGSVLTLLQELVRHDQTLVGYPCISMLRVLFGSMETPLNEETDENQKALSLGLNATKLETFRWRYHAKPHDKRQHGFAKVILDVSAIPDTMLYNRSEMVYSIHRPFRDICGAFSDQKYSFYRHYPIAANHYLGSWERYSGRKDARRNRKVYDKKANVSDGTDDGIKPWLSGFVQNVGMDHVQILLGDHLLKGTEHNNRNVPLSIG